MTSEEDLAQAREAGVFPINDNPWIKKMQALAERRESGQINDAQFEKESRALFMHLQAAAQKERARILAWALANKKVRDEAEYKRLCAHYHDEYGDSFHNFLTSIYAGANFLTLNEKMLDDARLLELRFGGRILNPEQAVALQEQEDAEKKAAEEREAEERKAAEVADGPSASQDEVE